MEPLVDNHLDLRVVHQTSRAAVVEDAIEHWSASWRPFSSSSSNRRSSTSLQAHLRSAVTNLLMLWSHLNDDGAGVRFLCCQSGESGIAATHLYRVKV